MESLAKPPFGNTDVERAFEAFPRASQDALLSLRNVVFQAAGETEGIGELVETLKWGQPSYLPSKPRVGSTLRLGLPKQGPGRYAMYFHCQTTLVDTFRTLYPDKFSFEGNRALVFTLGQDLPIEPLKHCVSLSLTYHLRARHAG